MISRGQELIRINPADSGKLEYSTDSGRNWYVRYSRNDSVGSFTDLLDQGNEILATTSKGLFYSTDSGHNWYKRN
jgi:photosystem II stability/assembly factor-like uncharacterized protein